MVKVFTIIKDQSERVKEKNFREINGIPLWRILISELSENFDITINTDSERLLEQFNKHPIAGVSIIKRKSKHIEWENDPNNKTSPVEDMLFDYCSKLDKSEIVVLTHVTSPFLNVETVSKAVKFLQDQTYFKSVHSVEMIRDFTWLKRNAQVVPVNFDPKVVQRTQDLPEIFVSKGAFFIARVGDILRQKKRLPDPVHYYSLSHLESIEIDTEADLSFAKLLREKK